MGKLINRIPGLCLLISKDTHLVFSIKLVFEKVIKCSASLAFDLFSSTRLINSINPATVLLNSLNLFSKK